MVTHEGANTLLMETLRFIKDVNTLESMIRENVNNPHSHCIQLRLAQLYISMQETDKASTILNKLLDEHARDEFFFHETLYAMGGLNAVLNQVDLAISFFGMIPETNPRCYEKAQVHLALLTYRQNPCQALLILKKYGATAIESRLAVINYVVGRIYMDSMMKPEKAIKRWNKILSFHPNYIKSRFHILAYYAKEDQCEDKLLEYADMIDQHGTMMDKCQMHIVLATFYFSPLHRNIRLFKYHCNYVIGNTRNKILLNKAFLMLGLGYPYENDRNHTESLNYLRKITPEPVPEIYKRAQQFIENIETTIRVSKKRIFHEQPSKISDALLHVVNTKKRPRS